MNNLLIRWPKKKEFHHIATKLKSNTNSPINSHSAQVYLWKKLKTQLKITKLRTWFRKYVNEKSERSLRASSFLFKKTCQCVKCTYHASNERKKSVCDSSHMNEILRLGFHICQYAQHTYRIQLSTQTPNERKRHHLSIASSKISLFVSWKLFFWLICWIFFLLF